MSVDDKGIFDKRLIDFYNQSCFSIDDFMLDSEVGNIKNLFDYCQELEDMYSSNFIEMKNGIIMSNNLYDIWYAIEVFGRISGYTIDVEKFMNDLTNMFVFDIIVSQGDRHADNWSVVIHKDTDILQLSALYDNSGALALNRGKAIANIDDFSKRLKIETKPGKIKGIHRQMKDTINHSFSGVKVSFEDVKKRSRNDELIENFITQSSDEFVAKLDTAISLLSEDNIELIFNNIESKTGVPVPEIVKNVTREVLNHNIRKIEEKISVLRGEKNGLRKI